MALNGGIVSLVANNLATEIGTIISNLQQRPDVRKDSVKKDIQTFLVFQQDLMNFMQATAPGPNQAIPLLNSAKGDIAQLLAELIIFNNDMLQKGQLNTAKIISPEMATAHVAALKMATEADQSFISSLSEALSAPSRSDGATDYPFDPTPQDREALFDEWLSTFI